MKNLTPQHMRCGPFNCPSVHELDDGRLAVVGKTLGPNGSDEIALKAYAKLAAEDAIGSDETAIIIDRALLATIRDETIAALLEAAGQWNADMDAAPKDGTMIMVWCPTMAGERMPRIVRWRETRGSFPWEDPDGGNGAISAHQPTHWRHLPAPPETDA